MSGRAWPAAAPEPWSEPHDETKPQDGPVKEVPTGRLIRIVLVDDQGLFRDGLAGLLAGQMDIEVLSSTSTDRSVALVGAKQPDVVLLGSDDPEGLADHLHHMIQASPLSKIIILATHDDPRRVRHFLSSGAHAYMMKSARIDELLTMIRVVDRNQDRVVLSVSRQAADRLQIDQDMPLSERELEVLRLVADGMRNSQIAGRLYIAEGTVKRHLTNIYSKLGATSRTDAVRKAARQGLDYG
jgi:DNA-binding NarL/FixJ family response regulator